MTSPFDSSSPFSDNANGSEGKKPNNTSASIPAGNNTAKDEFLIHTMKDDLSALQAKIVEKAATPKIVPPTATKEESSSPKTDAKNEPSLASESFSSPQQPKVTPPQTSIEEKAVNHKEPEKKSSSLKILSVIVIILLILIAGLGGYYYWITKLSNKQAIINTPAPNQNTAPVNNPDPMQAPAPIPSAPVQQAQEKYSQDKPNYLEIDLATINSSDIKESLLKVASDLNASKPGSLYEFVVVDANNNPVAFPIFATAAKLNLSQNLLSSLGSDFSLFFYNDNGNIRITLEAITTNKKITLAELTKEEKNFPTSASFLFLDATPEIKSGNFHTSTYNGVNIRYINLDKALTLSIDYAMVDSKLFIGTSKKAIRSVLDKNSSTISPPSMTTTSSIPTNPVGNSSEEEKQSETSSSPSADSSSK